MPCTPSVPQITLLYEQDYVFFSVCLVEDGKTTAKSEVEVPGCCRARSADNLAVGTLGSCDRTYTRSNTLSKQLSLDTTNTPPQPPILVCLPASVTLGGRWSGSAWCNQ